MVVYDLASHALHQHFRYLSLERRPEGGPPYYMGSRKVGRPESSPDVVHGVILHHIQQPLQLSGAPVHCQDTRGEGGLTEGLSAGCAAD